MKILIKQSCAGADFAFTTGDEGEVDDKIAKDLIKAKYAEEVKTNGRQTTGNAPKA